jgi:cobalt-zinc-cadmium efflux system membrane fusion protein
MPTKKSAVILLVTVISGLSCGNKTRPVNPVITDSSNHAVAVHLSPEDAGLAGIKLGSLSEKKVDKWAYCKGNLVMIREGLMAVSTPAAGIVRMLNCSAGDYVEKGSVLAELESIEFIRLQQEFLDAENQVAYFREEYKRQGELTVENATSVKKMQMAQRDYQSFEIKQNALHLQLEAYGINPDSLKPDKLSPLFLIRAPQSGNVVSLNSTLGSYADLGEELMVLSKKNRLLLKLSVPEQSLPYLKKGQVIDFSLLHDSLKTFRAVLHDLANPVDPILHTSDIYGNVTLPNELFLPGTPVKARISTNTGISYYAPKDAVMHDPEGDFLFFMNQGIFEKAPVKTGNSQGEQIEIVEFPLGHAKDSVVTGGMSYLNKLLQKR